VITGRVLSDITRLVDTQKLIVAALHGIEIRYPDGKEFVWKQAEENQVLIQEIKNRSVQEFQQVKEIYIEDKKYSMAFHYRQVPTVKSKDFIEKFISIYKKIDREKKLEVLHGDKVIEIRPKGWNKGKAVEKILKKLKNKKNDLLPIYIGDDTTDEDAFKFLRRQGLNIYVKNDSELETLAHYYVRNPSEVYKFLEWLKKNIE
jgi:trehalose-phosphatase